MSTPTILEQKRWALSSGRDLYEVVFQTLAEFYGKYPDIVKNYTCPIETHQDTIMKLHPKDGEEQIYDIYIMPNLNNSPVLACAIEDEGHHQKLLYTLLFKQMPHSVSPKPNLKPKAREPQPKPKAKQPQSKPEVYHTPKRSIMDDDSDSDIATAQRLIEELRRDGIHTRVGTRNIRKREPFHTSVEHLHTSTRKEMKIDPKYAQQPSSPQPPRSRRTVIRDEDSDSDVAETSQTVLPKDYKFFDPQHPLKHPEDDDYPLYCLIKKPLKYIEATIGNKCDGFASIIRNTGLSMNEARKYQNLASKQRRLEKGLGKDFDQSIAMAKKRMDQFEKLSQKQEELRKQLYDSLLKVFDSVEDKEQ